MKQLKALLWTSGGSFAFELFKWPFQGSDYSGWPGGGPRGPRLGGGRLAGTWACCLALVARLSSGACRPFCLETQSPLRLSPLPVATSLNQP